MGRHLAEGYEGHWGLQGLRVAAPCWWHVMWGLLNSSGQSLFLGLGFFSSGHIVPKKDSTGDSHGGQHSSILRRNSHEPFQAVAASSGSERRDCQVTSWRPLPIISRGKGGSSRREMGEANGTFPCHRLCHLVLPLTSVIHICRALWLLMAERSWLMSILG